MSAQHTPGPWRVAKSIYQDEAKRYSIYRDAGTRQYEVMRDRRGYERRFATEAAALAAIAKATGSAT